MKDRKAALGNGTKPNLSHVRSGIKTYCARACEYGSDKYERGNFLRPSAENPTLRDDFERLREYLEAVDRHLSKVFDSMERQLAMDPSLQDEEGMRRAAYAADTDPGNDKVGPSNLPHLAHLSAGLMMAIEQSINSGLLPADPGQTWDKDPPVELVVADSVETRGAKPGVMIEYDVLLSTSGDCSRETAEPNTGWNPVREIIKSR